MRSLDGVRVLEVGERLGVASTGLFLAALAGDVTQVRLPTRRVPAAESAYYDRGRRILEVKYGEDLSALAALADIIVTDLRDDAAVALGLVLDEDSLRATLPTPATPPSPSSPSHAPPRFTSAAPQVAVTIRPLGRTGPHASYRMNDLTEWAAGGLANVTRRPYPDDPDRYVPVVPPGWQPQALAGLAGATGAIVARRWAATRGRPVCVDVSVQEVVAATLHSIFPNFVFNGTLLGHPSTPTAAAGMLLPAADGDVYVRTVEAHQWDKLVAWVGDETLASLGVDVESRRANHDALHLIIAEWASSQTRTNLVVEGQRRKVPIAMPRSLEDTLAWQHLRARGAWTTIDGINAPTVPMLEPPTWTPSRPVTQADVERTWSS